MKVCDEVCTVTAAPANAVFQFGTGTSFSAPKTLALPIVADCSIPCGQFGGDPAVGIGKTLYAQRQAAAFTVTTNTGVVVVPGTAVAGALASTSQNATVTTADKTLVLKVPVPALVLACTTKNGKITCQYPGATITLNVTIPGQAASVTPVPTAYKFTAKIPTLPDGTQDLSNVSIEMVQQ